MRTPAKWRLAFMLACLIAGSVVLHYRDIGRWIESYRTRAEVMVQDESGLLAEEQRQWIAAYHLALLEEHDIDLRVVLTRSGGDINAVSYQTYQRMAAGSLSEAGRGLLLLIDVQQDQVRLEVSGSLEPVYTDAFVAYLQQRQMVPYFNVDRVGDGILATTELIVSRARDAAAGHAFMPPGDSASIGGGATANAGIGKGKAATPAYRSRETDIQADGLEPQEVVASYFEAMANRDARPNLPIYSRAAREMMGDWVVTAAQMDNLVNTYKACESDGTLILGGLAVVRYRVEQRQCAPFFLSLEEGEWRLDLQLMSGLLRFNNNNQWRFDPQARHPYLFAFGDWRFDRNGYPHPLDTTRLRWQLSTHTRDEQTFVTWVGVGSAAERLGLLYGDVVLDWNGRTPRAGDMGRLMRSAEPGTDVRVKVQRGERVVVLSDIAPAFVR